MLHDTRATLRMLGETLVALAVLGLTVLILVAVAHCTPGGTGRDEASPEGATGTPQEIGAALEEALAQR